MPKFTPPNSVVCDDGQKRAFFTLGFDKCDAVNAHRKPQQADQTPKKYVGFDRVNRVLRHLAFAIFQQNRDLVEVQACIVGGRLHLSSNAQSETIVQALKEALSQGHNSNRRPSAHRMRDRHTRGLRDLNQFVHDKSSFLATRDKVISETSRDISTPRFQQKSRNLLTPDQVAIQAERNLSDLHEILLELVDGDASRIDVHAPAALPRSHTRADGATMHAEQNIQQALAAIYMTPQQIGALREYYGFEPGADIPVIVPIDGRLVPCALCYEVEHKSQTEQSALFNPIYKKLILYRSSARAGQLFPAGSKPQLLQHATLGGLAHVALGKAKAIINSFRNNQHSRLASSQLEIVHGASYNTDSEDSTASLTPAAQQPATQQPAAQQPAAQQPAANPSQPAVRQVTKGLSFAEMVRRGTSQS